MANELLNDFPFSENVEINLKSSFPFRNHVRVSEISSLLCNPHHRPTPATKAFYSCVIVSPPP